MGDHWLSDHAVFRRRLGGCGDARQTYRSDDRERCARGGALGQHRVPALSLGRGAGSRRRNRVRACQGPRADPRRRFQPDHGRHHSPRPLRRESGRRRDHGPAHELLEAQRRGDIPPLRTGGGRRVRPRHGLQQPGDGGHRHEAGIPRPVAGDLQRHHGQGKHRRHRAHGQVDATNRRPGRRLQRAQSHGAGRLRRRRQGVDDGLRPSRAAPRRRVL